MEVLPADYASLEIKNELSRQEKMFAHYALSSEEYGFLMLKVNPEMRKGESVDIVITSRGVVLCKFFDDFDDAAKFVMAMGTYSAWVYPSNKKVVSQMMLSNKTISTTKAELKFPVAYVHIFPKLKNHDIEKLALMPELKSFVEHNCMFAEEFSKLRTSFAETIERFLQYPIVPVGTGEKFIIGDNNVNAIIQRLAPEYVTVRIAEVKDSNGTKGADEELLVVDENDVAVKAFRLDREQINIVNKITKGEQLILACAGSGKSVLLISKCFKAARMNPDKKFLITCYNDNLKSLYTWYIDRAGLKEKNVVCLTFYSLCKRLLEKNGFTAGFKDFDGWVTSAIDKLNAGKIKERFYGIFIDEVQIFQSEWYKFCYNLLENKSSEDHLFVICGDKTQNLEKLKKNRKAPWQAGEGYPVYRGNRSIRIERNYRNCIEINEFINRYVSNAKQYLYTIQSDFDVDPDLFLRGKAVFHGIGVEYKQLTEQSNRAEVQAVIESINKIHDVNGIPYDEIAVIMHNGSYRARIPGWKDSWYMLADPLLEKLEDLDIPKCKLYASEGEWQDHFGETGGVRLIKFRTTLGLDFRAAIICGLKPFGYHDKVKKPDWDALKQNDEEYFEAVENTKACIRNLYVACTRAKEILHIIAPESVEDSAFIKILKDSI